MFVKHKCRKKKFHVNFWTDRRTTVKQYAHELLKRGGGGGGEVIKIKLNPHITWSIDLYSTKCDVLSFLF